MFENYENLSGIYCITNVYNNKKYIGKTKNMKTRFNQHRWELNKNHKDHKNEHLQNAWNKYGENWFIFQALYIMEDYTDEEANDIEISFIELLRTSNRSYGYNKTFGGDGGDTFSLLSDEQKEKRRKLLSQIGKGRKFSEETRRLISESKKGKNNPNFGKATWNKGIKYSDEVRKQMSERMKGKMAGEKNPMYGKTHTKEARKKISETHKGKKLSEEHRRMISERMKGENNPNYGNHYKLRAETRRKISEANKGRKVSEETRRKLSECQIGEKNHQWKDYARVKKRGFTTLGQQKYTVIYEGKDIKTSIFKEKMEKLAEEINKKNERERKNK